MPTRASLNTQLQDIMRFYREARNYGSNNGANDMDSMVRTFQGNLDSGWGAETEAAIDQWQQALATSYDSAAPLLSHLRDWGVFLAVPNPNDIKSVCQYLYKDAVDNTQRFVTRGFTRGTPTAGSNTGTGTWRRITTDPRSFPMEGSFGADVWAARCVSDASTPGGQRNGEGFEVRARNKAKWSFTPSGSGVTDTITAIDPRNAGFLLNPSFDQRSGSNNAPTAITNWSSSVGVSASSYRFVSGSDNCFLPIRTPTDVIKALSIRTSQTLAQRLDLGGGRFNPDVPYNFAINYLASASGTLRIRLGAVSASKVVSAGQTTWATLEITGTYYRSFATSILRASIVTQSIGGGTGKVKVDDATLAPYKGIDGTWHINRPGRTPYRAGTWKDSTGDTFAWTDTATESVMQRHYARLTKALGGGPAGGGFYQPSTSAGGAGVVAEPS